MLLPGTFPPVTPQDMLNTALEYAPDAGEYLGAHVSQAYDRTTTARAAEEYGIMQAEKDEGTWDQQYAQGQAMLEHVTGTGVEAPAHNFAMTEDQWKASEYYESSMKYRPDMTVTRARIMKENFDQRRYLDQLVQRGDEAHGPGMKALGFGASLLGSLPDPVNFIPFAGGLKGASVGAGLARGALEGAVGNALVDALVLPDLANKGEDVGMADALLDITFGAVLGGALGGLGGYIGKRWGKGTDTGTAGSRLADFDASPDGNLMARAGQDMLPRHADADLLRASLGAQDKADLARGMEKALADVHADSPVDVAPILRESEALSRAYDAVKRDPLGGPPDEVLAVLSSPEFERILVERGPAAMDSDGNITVRSKEFAQQFGNRAWGLVKIIWRHGEKNQDPNPALRVTKEDVVNLPQVMRDYAPVETADRKARTKETRWTVQGEDGIDVVYSIARRKGQREQTLITIFRHDRGQYGQSAKRKPPDSSKTVNSHHSDKTAQGDTAGGQTAYTPRSQEANQLAGKTNISPDRPEVNYAVERPDDTPPAPPLPEAQRELAEELGLDPATGLLPEERAAADLDTAGRVTPEDRDALLAAQEQARRVQDYDDIAQGIIPCILEVPHGE